MNTKTIIVAGYRILIQAENIADIGLELGYLPFEIPNNNNSPDIKIKSVRGIASSLLNTKGLLFEAQDNSQVFFSVYKESESYKFIVYNPVVKNTIQQIALLNSDFSEWIIYSDNSFESEEISPLLYPMGPLILYYLAIKHNMIMIHASGVRDGNNGLIFSGFSGSGKSTMADLWQRSGGQIINDDRIIIRKENQRYYMYNTPMFYADVPKKSSLDSLFIISHSNKNQLNRLEGARAVSNIMAFCIQHGYNSRFIDSHLDFLADLCLNLPVYALGFVPDKKIVDFIKANGI